MSRLVLLSLFTACTPADPDPSIDDPTSETPDPEPNQDDLFWSQDFEDDFNITIWEEEFAEARTVSVDGDTALEIWLEDVLDANGFDILFHASFHVALGSQLSQETTYRFTFDTEGDAACRIALEGSGMDLTLDPSWTSNTLEYTTGLDDSGIGIDIECSNEGLEERSRRFDHFEVVEL